MGASLTDAATNSPSGVQSSVHTAYQNVSLFDPTAVTHVVGNITYLWWQTNPLPMLGTTTNSWVDTLDAELRPGIESAYSRPVAIPSPWTISAAAHLSGRGIVIGSSHSKKFIITAAPHGHLPRTCRPTLPPTHRRITRALS